MTWPLHLPADCQYDCRCSRMCNHVLRRRRSHILSIAAWTGADTGGVQHDHICEILLIEVASQGNILLFKENSRLYYGLRLKAIVGRGSVAFSTLGSQSREPGFEYSCCLFEALAISFIPRCHSSN